MSNQDVEPAPAYWDFGRGDGDGSHLHYSTSTTASEETEEAIPTWCDQFDGSVSDYLSSQFTGTTEQLQTWKDSYLYWQTKMDVLFQNYHELNPELPDLCMYYDDMRMLTAGYFDHGLIFNDIGCKYQSYPNVTYLQNSHTSEETGYGDIDNTKYYYYGSHHCNDLNVAQHVNDYYDDSCYEFANLAPGIDSETVSEDQQIIDTNVGQLSHPIVEVTEDGDFHLKNYPTTQFAYLNRGRYRDLELLCSNGGVLYVNKTFFQSCTNKYEISETTTSMFVQAPYEELSEIMWFITSGELNVHLSQLQRLLDAADELELEAFAQPIRYITDYGRIYGLNLGKRRTWEEESVMHPIIYF